MSLPNSVSFCPNLANTMWAVALSFALLVSGCGGGGGSGGGNIDGGTTVDFDAAGNGDGGTTTTAPVFSGIQLAYSPAAATVALQWLEASDDTTAAADIKYLIYTGDADLETAVANGQAPAATVVGDTTYEMSGLTPDVDVFFLVLAEDSDGERNPTPRVVLVRPLAEDLTTVADVHDLAALGITVVENGLNDFTISGAGADTIAVGDIVLLDNTFGRSLRRVTAKQPASAGYDIITEKASLSEIVSKGELRSYVGVGASPEVAANRRISLTAPTGAPRTDAFVKNGVGIESRDYGDSAIGSLANEITLESGVTLDYTVSFEAGVEAEARWTESIINTPDHIRAVAKGVLAVDAKAAYTLNGAANYDAKKELFSKTYTFSYLVGGLPVIQDVSVSFMAELEFNAEANIVMELVGHAEKSLTFGFEWDDSTGYKLIEDQGFENEVTFNLEGEAGAHGVLRVYPVLSTSLYKAARLSLTVMPQLLLDAEARLLPLPAEILKFNLDFLVTAFAAADLTIFGAEIASWQSDTIELVRIPIHSQPSTGLLRSQAQLDTCGTRKVTLGLSQGYNNEVQPGNISWKIDNPNSGTMLTVASGNHTAEFSADSPGDYTISVSTYGDGLLGILGTRYVSTTINVVDAPPGDCDPANSMGGGEGDLLTCQPEVPIGLTGAPFPEKTTIVAGDDLVYNAPLYCGWNCEIEGALRGTANVTGNTSILAGAYLWGSYIPFAGDVTLTVSTDTYGPGVVWPSYIRVFWFNGNGEPYVLVYSSLDGTGNFKNWGSNDTDPDWLNWTQCTNDDSGIPVTPIRIVGAGDPDDADDSPDEARPIDVNGGQYASTIRYTGDEDWVAFTPSVNAGPYGSPYDADAPIFPNGVATGCWLVIEAPVWYLRLYGSQADAAAGINLLAQAADKLIYPAVADTTYFLEMSGAGTADRPYTVQVAADCTNLAADLPALTGTPSFVSNTVTTAETITVTVPYSSNVGRVQVSLRPVAGGSVVQSYTNTAAAGTTSWTLDMNPSGLTPGDYALRVNVRKDGASDSQTYDFDGAYSNSHYAVTTTSATYPAQTTTSDIPLAIVTVTAP